MIIDTNPLPDGKNIHAIWRAFVPSFETMPVPCDALPAARAKETFVPEALLENGENIRNEPARLTWGVH
jgi:hypothetical protein